MGTKHLLGTGRAYEGKESFKAGLTGQGQESHGRREEYAAVQGLRAQAFVSVTGGRSFWFPDPDAAPAQVLPQKLAIWQVLCHIPKWRYPETPS